MRFLSIISVALIAAACGGSNATAPATPVTGTYAGSAATGSTLSITADSYYFSVPSCSNCTNTLVEAGTWTPSGSTLSLTPKPGWFYQVTSTLTVGDGTLDGFIYGAQRHFTRTGS